MKTCTACKQNKPFDQFNRKTSNKDGLERYCKKCHRAKNRRHYEQNKVSYKQSAARTRNARVEWWKEYKNTLSCETCGESRHWVLDFHHPDPSEKEGNISSMINTSGKGKILAEVAKCVVLCRNCHADIHYHMR